jgi:hypothetical protein
MKLDTDNVLEMHCVSEKLNSDKNEDSLTEVDHSISNEYE